MQLKSNSPVLMNGHAMSHQAMNSTRHVLVADGDLGLRRRLREALKDEPYNVHETDNGADAFCFGATGRYDGIILDVTLGGHSALEILDQWRADGLSTPVVLTDARGTWRDRVRGLQSGADDYLTKPFEVEEMIARLEAIWRRSAGWAPKTIASNDLVIDLVGRSASYRGSRAILTALEFKVLRYLVENNGRTVPAKELLAHAYGAGADYASNAIEVTISRIRGKLHRSLIRTHRGRGYIVDL